MNNQKAESKMENKANELTMDEMEQVSGGNFFDDVSCFFGAHDYKNVDQRGNLNTNEHVAKFICNNCGKVCYEKYYANGKSESISSSDFYAFMKNF